MRPRKQCSKCPWKKSTDPRTIPGGYCEAKHQKLADTIAEPGALPLRGSPLRIMACHESPIGREVPCVGWLVNQLGPGQNLALRLAVHDERIDANVVTVGPQHERFEDTLPKE